MKYMHFHLAHNDLFLRNFVLHLGDPNKQFGTHEKLSWGAWKLNVWVIYKLVLLIANNLSYIFHVFKQPCT